MASKAAKGGYADQQLAVTLKDGKKSLNKAKDYIITCSGNKAIGKGSITLNAKGNYKGTIKNIAAYDIVAKSIASEDITVAVDDVFYKEGANITPKLTVYDNGVKVNAKDYTVAFADGSAKLAGYKLPDGAEYADIDLTVTVTYKESKNAQELMLANSETEGYLVGYGTNTKTGSASVIIYGTGKYGGSKTVKFTIYPKWMKWIFG